MQNTRNLGPQISFISSYANFTPNQKHRPAGIEYNAVTSIGLSFHQSHTNCEFSWNQTKVCPITNSAQAAINLVLIILNLTVL